MPRRDSGPANVWPESLFLLPGLLRWFSKPAMVSASRVSVVMGGDDVLMRLRQQLWTLWSHMFSGFSICSAANERCHEFLAQTLSSVFSKTTQIGTSFTITSPYHVSSKDDLLFFSICLKISLTLRVNSDRKICLNKGVEGKRGTEFWA